MNLNIPIARLQYEILGQDPETIARSMGIVPYMIENLIETEGWKSLWPEENFRSADDAEQVIESTTLRLRVYNALTALVLSVKYTELESGLLDACSSALAEVPDDDSRALVEISRVYTALKSKTFQVSDDLSEISGVPEVITKNLSGFQVKDLNNLELIH